MTASSQQIVTAFEDVGLTPEVIAEEFDFDLTVVKATLMQFSAKYREAAEHKSDLDFDKNEAKEMQDIILQIARYSEDDHLRFKAARYVRDDKKGRLDLAKQLSGLNINVLQFNTQMQRAIEATKRAKQIAATVVEDAEQNRSHPVEVLDTTVAA